MSIDKTKVSQREYNQWHVSVHGQENPNLISLEKWHKHAYALYNDIKEKSVLEIGCGVGDFALFLNKDKAHVTAVDFSESAIELAKRKARAQNASVDFAVADAQSLPFESASFDVIYSCECLEHIPNPQKALDEMYRVLRPGGRLILSTENYSNAMVVLWLKAWLTKKPFNSGEAVQPIEHFFLFWNVIAKMKRSGFSLIKFDGWHFVFLILPKNLNIIVEEIKSSVLRSLFKPFARHITYVLKK